MQDPSIFCVHMNSCVNVNTTDATTARFRLVYMGLAALSLFLAVSQISVCMCLISSTVYVGNHTDTHSHSLTQLSGQYTSSGGRAPADMGGEPPDGRAKGRRVLTSRPPEETLTHSIRPAHESRQLYSY